MAVLKGKALAPQRVRAGDSNLGGHHAALRRRRHRQDRRVSSQGPAPNAHAFGCSGSGGGFLICVGLLFLERFPTPGLYDADEVYLLSLLSARANWLFTEPPGNMVLMLALIYG
jgi:hypothetical protein